MAFLMLNRECKKFASVNERTHTFLLNLHNDLINTKLLKNICYKVFHKSLRFTYTGV